MQKRVFPVRKNQALTDSSRNWSTPEERTSMSQQIYIGNLPFETTEEEVRKLCSPFGKVKSVAMIRDRDSGRFRGFCFVEMDDAAATAAIADLDGKEVGGRKIKVNKARPRKGEGRKKDRSRGKQSGRSKQQRQNDRDSQPLHERTQRGLSDDEFPYSGGGRGRYRGRDQGRDNGNSEFPFSGGSRRG
jgi:RNA recognition motif-containing protein